MAFDRSKFKATSVAAAKQADQEVEQITGKNGGRGPSADYHKIVDGIQIHRIYPPHPADGGQLYAVPKGVHWIPQEVPEFDKQGNIVKDKNDNVITKVANRPIFNAKIHGGFKKDIIEEYIAFAQKYADDTFTNEKERKEYLDPIIGGFESKFDGIMLRQSWVMYTDLLEIGKDGNIVRKALGRLDIGKAIKNRLNAIAATEAGNEPLGTDPFTDPEEGRAISIIYNKKATKPADYYTTELYAPLISGGKGQIRLYPLSDADLEKFETYPSLQKMFVGVYDRKTFDNAVKGLKMFDDEHELGIFAYEEFLDICEELSAEIPDNGSSEAEAADEQEPDGKDEFDKMDRDELKAYIRTNKLNIVVNKQLDDDNVRDAIREALLDQEGEGKEGKDPKGKGNATAEHNDSTDPDAGLPFKVEDEGKGKGAVSSSAKDRIAKMKEAAAAKKAAGK